MLGNDDVLAQRFSELMYLRRASTGLEAYTHLLDRKRTDEAVRAALAGSDWA